MSIAHLCEITGSLPNPGGLLQQRTGHIKRLQAVYRAREKYRSEEYKKAEQKANV